MDKVIDRDPERADYLRRGLLQHPRSLYRARTFTENPPDVKAEVSRYMGWYEWGPTLAILTQILNSVMVSGGGKSAASKTLKAPTERGKRSEGRTPESW